MQRYYGICFRWPQGNIRWVYTQHINIEIAFDNFEFQDIVRFQSVVQQGKWPRTTDMLGAGKLTTQMQTTCYWLKYTYDYSSYIKVIYYYLLVTLSYKKITDRVKTLWPNPVVTTIWGGPPQSLSSSFNTLRPSQVAAIFHTTYWNAFSWIKIYEFRLKFHWNLFLSAFNNESALGLEIAQCRRTGDKALSEPILSPLTHIWGARGRWVNIDSLLTIFYKIYWHANIYGFWLNLTLWTVRIFLKNPARQVPSFTNSFIESLYNADSCICLVMIIHKRMAHGWFLLVVATWSLVTWQQGLYKLLWFGLQLAYQHTAEIFKTSPALSSISSSQPTSYWITDQHRKDHKRIASKTPPYIGNWIVGFVSFIWIALMAGLANWGSPHQTFLINLGGSCRWLRARL